MDTTTVIFVTTGIGVGLALIAITVAIVPLVRRNRAFSRELRRLVDNHTALETAASQQVDAAHGLMEELRQKAALATMPILVLLDEPPIGIRDQPWAAVRVRNVGNGSALHFIVWMRVAGSIYHSGGAEARGFSQDLHLAVGDTFEPGPFQNMLYVGQQRGSLDPGPAVVGEDGCASLMAFCGDAMGNRYRFNLRTGDPAGVWERGADAPPWAGAWDPRLSSGRRVQREGATAPTSIPELDPGPLVDALQGLLHALRDATPDEHVGVMGRVNRRPRVTEGGGESGTDW